MIKQLKDHYLHEIVEAAPPFGRDAKDRLNDALSRLTDLYTKCVTRGDKAAAKQQLQLHQRENIAWERDTVWRQMIGSERRGGENGTPKAIVPSAIKEAKAAIIDIETPIGRFRVTRRKLFMLAAIVVLIILLNVQTVEGVEANRCFAILVFCTIMWATEVGPVFAWSAAHMADKMPGYTTIRYVYVGTSAPCDAARHSECRWCQVVHTRRYKVRRSLLIAGGV